MGDHKEIRHLRLFVKVPGGDKLRKTAAGRLRYLLNAGWRETERVQETDYLAVRLERSGHRPPMTNIPKAPPPQQRGRRDFGRGGPRDQQRGGPRQQQSGPPGPTPTPAPASAPPATQPTASEAPAAAPAKPPS